MTKILELPEELMQDLHRAAARDQISDEDLAFRVLREYLAREDHRRKVKEAGDYVQQKNAELYRRLA